MLVGARLSPLSPSPLVSKYTIQCHQRMPAKRLTCQEIHLRRPAPHHPTKFFQDKSKPATPTRNKHSPGYDYIQHRESTSSVGLILGPLGLQDSKRSFHARHRSPDRARHSFQPCSLFVLKASMTWPHILPRQRSLSWTHPAAWPLYEVAGSWML